MSVICQMGFFEGIHRAAGRVVSGWLVRGIRSVRHREGFGAAPAKVPQGSFVGVLGVMALSGWPR